MKARNTVVAFAVLLVGLVGGWASAQVYVAPRVVPVQPPVVMAGIDLGFRIEGRSGDVQIGTLVVKIDGNWVPTQFPNASGPKLLR